MKTTQAIIKPPYNDWIAYIFKEVKSSKSTLNKMCIENEEYLHTSNKHR